MCPIPSELFTECSPTALGFIVTLQPCGRLQMFWCSPILPSEFHQIEYLVRPEGLNNVFLVLADSNGNAETEIGAGTYDITMKVYKNFPNSNTTPHPNVGCCGNEVSGSSYMSCILTIEGE